MATNGWHEIRVAFHPYENSVQLISGGANVCFARHDVGGWTYTGYYVADPAKVTANWYYDGKCKTRNPNSVTIKTVTADNKDQGWYVFY